MFISSWFNSPAFFYFDSSQSDKVLLERLRLEGFNFTVLDRFIVQL